MSRLLLFKPEEDTHQSTHKPPKCSLLNKTRGYLFPAKNIYIVGSRLENAQEYKHSQTLLFLSIVMLQTDTK